MANSVDLTNRVVVVAGGTGNVGSFLTQGLLLANARVVVPSRSEQKIGELRRQLTLRAPTLDLGSLFTYVSDIASPESGQTLLRRVEADLGRPDRVIASLGMFRPVESLLTSSRDALETALDNYLIAHFQVSRLFLPYLKEQGGRYVFVNGPLASAPSREGALVSIATAGQQMLFRCLAAELAESNVTVSELMNYAFIRDHKTQPSSAVPGEAVGTFAAYLLSDMANGVHGETIHLDSLELLKNAGIQ